MSRERRKTFAGGIALDPVTGKVFGPTFDDAFSCR
jgi:hypothetical protein